MSIEAHIDAYTHACILRQTYMHTCMLIHGMHAYTYRKHNTRIHTRHIHAYTHTYTYIHTYIHAYTYTCIHTYIHPYMYTQSHTQSHTHRASDMER
jgi:hypothetical protein